MSRVTTKGAARVDFSAKAETAWAPAPAWVRRLAEECDRIGQSAVAKLLDYSPSTVSQVLSNSYRGDMRRVQDMVLGALMAETVICPVKGEMSRNVCLTWQDKPFAATSSDRARMFHACRSGCPFSKHTRISKETSDA